MMFVKHSCQLSENFWEGLERMLTTNKSMLTVGLSSEFMNHRESLRADFIRSKTSDLSNCVGFIDGIVISIVRPNGSHVMQLVA